MSRFEDEHSGATEEDVMDSLNDDIEELTAQLAAERAAREKAEARVKVLEEALWKRWEDCICGGDGLIRCYNGAGQSHLDDCNKCADIRKALRGEEQGK
jgi:hypothetical protein